MLWSSNKLKLPNNFFSALVQFKSLEKRLVKDPVLYKRYAETIQDDLDKGYVIKLKKRENEHCAGREWYLPHHPVVNPNKPEKVRRVLNVVLNLGYIFKQCTAHCSRPLAETVSHSNTLLSTSFCCFR